VHIKHLEAILRDDDYRTVPRNQVYVGDLVVYLSEKSVEHVGVVYELKDVSPRLDRSIIEIWVLSQWGEDGEYLHPEAEVHPLYGNTRQYWSERRPEQ
jgi:hypothetical protein